MDVLGSRTFLLSLRAPETSLLARVSMKGCGARKKQKQILRGPDTGSGESGRPLPNGSFSRTQTDSMLVPCSVAKCRAFHCMKFFVAPQLAVSKAYDQEPYAVSRSLPPPPSKKITGSFLFVELISGGLPENSVMWLPEIISGELISVGLPESLAGSQRSVRRCERSANDITGNIGNTITGELIWNNYRKNR